MKIDIKYGDETLDKLTQSTNITYLTANHSLDRNIIVEAIDDGLDPSDATATAADILSPKTAYIADGSKATGTIATKSKTDIVIASNTATVPIGYYATSTTISASELVSGNIALSPSIYAQNDIDVKNYSTASISAVPTGTQGTPVATKGTVSNNSVIITTSCTDTTGYINGSTKSGNSITVTASELVSGSQTKTANGTYDVTNLASLVVAIPTYIDLS